MKRQFTPIALSLLLLGSPSWGQESSPDVIRKPDVLEQAAQKLGELSLREDQAQALIGILMRQLPKLLDENADPYALAKEIEPEANRILDPNQRAMLQEMDRQYQSSALPSMSKDERRRLVQDSLQRLSHPDAKEWLQRIDSFDL
jgi:hypothetical protein